MRTHKGRAQYETNARTQRALTQHAHTQHVYTRLTQQSKQLKQNKIIRTTTITKQCMCPTTN